MMAEESQQTTGAFAEIGLIVHHDDFELLHDEFQQLGTAAGQADSIASLVPQSS